MAALGNNGAGRCIALAGDAAILGQALDALACKARDLGLSDLAESIQTLGIEAAEIARFAAKLHH